MWAQNKLKYCLHVSAAMYATTSFRSGLLPLARMFKLFIILASVCFPCLVPPIFLGSHVSGYSTSKSFFNSLYNVCGMPNLRLNFFQEMSVRHRRLADNLLSKLMFSYRNSSSLLIVLPRSLLPHDCHSYQFFMVPSTASPKLLHALYRTHIFSWLVHQHSINCPKYVFLPFVVVVAQLHLHAI